jgi:O-antigen/teichoic acid export membrane protein
LKTPSQDLGVRVRKGVAWKASSQVVLQGSRIVVTIVLARLLAPEEYGLAAMVIVFGALVLVFSDLALGAALIQRRVLSEQDRSTVFWATLTIGTLFTVLGVAASGLVADFYGEPRVQPLFAVLALSFVITALGATQKALLTRDLDFKALELRLMGSTLLGAGVAIVVAVRGHGAWAIVVQHVAIAIGSTALLWAASPWRPRFVFSLTSLRALAGFSANVFGTRLLFAVSRNADNILVGRFLGSAALGAYSIAYNLMLAPIERISGPLQDVLFPAFSRMQNDVGRTATMWLRANRLVAAVSVPALVGFAVVAPELVRVVLGEKWLPAVPVVQILAFVGVLQCVQRLNSSVLQARDRTSLLFRFSLVASAANVVAFVIGLQWGIVGVAACYAISNALLQPLYTWLTARTVELSLVDCIRNLGGVAQAAALMGVLVLASRLLLLEQEVPPGARLLLLVSIGVIGYGLFCLWRAPELVADIRALRRSRARRNHSRASHPRPSTDNA